MEIASHRLSSSPSFSISRPGAPRLSMILAPVQALIALFMPIQAVQASHRPAVHSPLPRLSNTQIVGKRHPITAFKTAKAQPVSRLKVIREFEPGIGRSQAGRMAISGRMDDVCAELDRIAQKATLGS